jgi:hypothetical protein
VITRILLVWKQHRFEVLVTVAVGLFVFVGSVIEGLRLNAVSIPAGCETYAALYVQQGWAGPPFTAACLAASAQWLSIKNGFEMNFIPTAPWMLPLFFGILLGAPLVAREVENSTAPLSWALAGSRRRWLAWRMAAMVVLLVPLLLALGFASDFFDAAANRGMNPWASFVDYAGRGVILVFWGLAAFAGTVALSTLLGRTVPALALAAIVCLLVRGTWEAGANHTFLRSISEMLVSQSETQPGETSWPDQSALITYQQTWLQGKPWSGDMMQWWEEHPVSTTEPDGTPVQVMGPVDAASAAQGPYLVPFGFPGSLYWPVVGLECLILAAGAVLCAGVGLFWVGGRRPY